MGSKEFVTGYFIGMILGITIASAYWYLRYSDKERKSKPETMVEVTYPWGKDTIRTREELSLNLDGVLKTRYSVLDSNVVSIRKIK